MPIHNDVRVCLHIGNPKAYSTSLQGHFFQAEKAGKVAYCGFRPDQDFHRWYKSSLESQLLNLHLRYTSTYRFNSHFSDYSAYIEHHVNAAGVAGVPWVMSSENLNMQWLQNEIDTAEKYARLQRLIPQKKHVFVVFRNIKQALMSIYKELVKQGYCYGVEHFLTETYLSRYHNFIDGLLPHIVYAQLTNNLRNAELHFIYTDNQPDIKHILALMNVPYYPAESYNSSYSLAYAKVLSDTNARLGYRTDLSGLSELHRQFWDRLEEPELSDFLWSKLRATKNAMHVANESVLSEVDDELIQFEEAFEMSELKGYLYKQATQASFFTVSSNKELIQTGEIDSVWHGL